MEQIKAGERFYILNNFRHFDETELSEWHNKLNQRIIYLNPIIDFIEQIKYNILNISKELSQEYFEIKSLIELLEKLRCKDSQ